MELPNGHDFSAEYGCPNPRDPTPLTSRAHRATLHYYHLGHTYRVVLFKSEFYAHNKVHDSYQDLVVPSATRPKSGTSSSTKFDDLPSALKLRLSPNGLHEAGFWWVSVGMNRPLVQMCMGYLRGYLEA